MQPVAAVGASRYQPVQERHVTLSLPDRHVAVPGRGQRVDELRQLVVVGRQKSAAADPVVKVSEGRPREGKPIERAGAAAHLVEEDQGAIVGAPEDLGDLGHLHHEARLPVSDLVGESHPGEQRAHDADPGVLRRDERAAWARTTRSPTCRM